MSKNSAEIKRCKCGKHVGNPSISISYFKSNKTRIDGHDDICIECQEQIIKMNRENR